jgi:hypothetical protein
VLDFKTDKEIQVENHKEQLACYRDAVADLYLGNGTVDKIKTFLFYLRHGKEEEC